MCLRWAQCAPVTPAEGVCDIYAAGKTPCVAAHSMTRALYGAYAGPLYTVKRQRDGAVQDVFVLAAGGVADTVAQDKFCGDSADSASAANSAASRGGRASQALPRRAGAPPRRHRALAPT